MTGFEPRISLQDLWVHSNLFKNWAIPGLFSLFSSFLLTVNNCSIKVADDWIRTRVLWCWKQPLCHLCYWSHFPPNWDTFLLHHLVTLTYFDALFQGPFPELDRDVAGGGSAAEPPSRIDPAQAESDQELRRQRVRELAHAEEVVSDVGRGFEPFLYRYRQKGDAI